MAEEPINNAAPAAPVASTAPAADNSTAVISSTESTNAPASNGTFAPSDSSVTPPTVTSFLNSNTAPAEGAEATQVTKDAAPAATADTQKTQTASSQPSTQSEPAKTTEQNKAPEEKKTEASQNDGNKSEEPAPLPVYEPWTLPENVKLDEKESGEFNKLLGELQNTTKAEQAMFQKFGQTLVDRHVSAVNETVDRVHSAYNAAWQKQTDGWRESFVSDPEIGGKRQETTIRLANEFIDTHGGTAENKAAFRKVMEQTGLGVHPEVLRLLSNAMNKFREGRPLPANPPLSPSQSKTQKWYGKKSG